MARILVIDDDASLLQMMNLMLKRAGYTAILASSGQQGIEIARHERPDMAIVDVMMPDLSGYEVCRILREDPQTMDIPLLILTALSQPEQRDLAEDSGADAFVTKPVTRDDLVRHVDELLRTGARNVPAPLEPPPVTAKSPADTASKVAKIFEAPPPPPGLEPQPAAKPAAPAVTPPAPSPAPPPAEPAARPASTVPVVAVMGLGRGVGATTVAVNLALGLMQFGRSCLIDLDNQAGQVAIQLKMVPPKATWLDLLNITPGADKRMIGQALMLDRRTGVAILASPLNPVQEFIRADALEYIFKVLSEGFRRIVVDLPSTLNPMSITTLRRADHIVLIVGDDPADLVTAPAVLATVEALGVSGHLHFVLNHTRPHGVSHEAVMQALNHPLAADIPYEPAQVNAMTEGAPLVMSQPNSLFSRALLYLARQL